ncbi:hypothetical protein [Winogradskyella thalassocola]|nr:hypothetical protein [Winogradskyella thalassocola]
MNKSIIILFLISTIFSCQKNVDQIDIGNELRGNTFDIISIEEKDTITIEFKDSIYSVFSTNAFFEDMYRKSPWRITTLNSNQFLVIDSKTIAIKQRDENIFDGLLIGDKDYEITFKKRKSKWNKDFIVGQWVEKEIYDYRKNDSILKPPTVPLPPPPKNLTKNDLYDQPVYEIKSDSINVKYGYSKSKSAIDINSSAEYIKMEVKSDWGIVEHLWKIKKLNDSIMIVDKIITDKNNEYYSYDIKTLENIVLIKKR